MTVAFTFSYANWIAAFPQFSGVSSAMADVYFGIAEGIFENNTCNLAFPTGKMPILFNLLTAHIAWLMSPRDAAGNPSSSAGGGAPALVGRINTASEGSVSVGAEWKGSGSPSEDWYVQTQWGAAYWAMTAQYRTMRYLARPTFVPTAIFPSWPGRFR